MTSRCTLLWKQALFIHLELEYLAPKMDILLRPQLVLERAFSAR